MFRIEATRNTPVSFRGETYIRIGSYKKSLDDHPERERKIWNREHNYIFEREVAVSHVHEDDILDLIDYPGYFEMIKFPLPDNRKGILERMLQDKIILKEQGLYSITNLGVLLFAKNIEVFDNLTRKAVRVVQYDGKNRVKTKKEQSGKKGYAVGFEGLIRYIAGQLPSNEIIDKALRKEVTLYPNLAIRELVANAIIHQDFSIKGSSPMVEIFDNRIEITNPGKPLMARFMRRLNICEERGSGIDKVIFECEFNQLPAPEIIVGDNYTRIILYGHKTLREMDKQDKVRACYLHACLKYVSGEYLTNQSLRDRFGIAEQNYPMVSRIISDSLDARLIKDYDPENKSRKYAKYVPFWV